MHLWRPVVVVPDINRGLLAQKQRSDIAAAIPRRPMQRCVADIVVGIYVGSAGQQHLDKSFIATYHSQVAEPSRRYYAGRVVLPVGNVTFTRLENWK